jgi:hypothetical protein
MSDSLAKYSLVSHLSVRPKRQNKVSRKEKIIKKQHMYKTLHTILQKKELGLSSSIRLMSTILIRPWTFCSRMIRPYTLHPDFFTSRYVLFLKCGVSFVPKKTHCHKKMCLFCPCIYWLCKNLVCVFSKNVLANVYQPKGSRAVCPNLT